MWRSCFPYFALLFFQLALEAAAPERLQSASGRGETHVSLEQWARSKDFSFNWDRANKVVYLNTRRAKLSFFINSKKAVYNGLSLWLSTPVTANGNSVLISQRDLDKTILPILYPAKIGRGRSIRTIMIAPGHGGKDPGYQINQEQEKKYTLLMAKELKEALVAAGFRAVLTRETDLFVDLGEQAARANRAGADLFINLHYNAAVETEASGVETYCLTPAGAVSTNGGSPTPRRPRSR